MKVLHLPYNVGSQVSVCVRALRAIGVEARGVVFSGGSDTIQSHDGLDVLPAEPALPRSLRWARQHARRYTGLLSASAWADVLHWHFGYLMLRGGFDLTWARLLRKPGIVEFWGDDIRIAELEAADNPYYALHAPPEYLAQVTRPRSRETQARFSRAGFSCLVCDGQMQSYVQRDLFPRVHRVRQRMMLSDYAPRPPDPVRRRPLVVHSPSDPGRKGSALIQAAVDTLRSTHDFDFRLVTGVPRAEALSILAEADIFIDQVVFGAHGLATLEAMALAKPVLCYIKPSLLPEYPADLPVVNANPDNLTTLLGNLLADGERRRQLGLLGRAYVERYHDALRLAHELRSIYQETLARRP